MELLPVHAYINDKALIDRGLTNYWGYNSIGFFAPEGEILQQRHHRRTSNRVQADGAQPACCGPRGHSRRRLQPHCGRKSPRPHAQLPRHRQPGLLPALAGRSSLLHGFHRHREHLQPAPSAHPAARHGQPALLGARDARRRFSFRSRLHPRARRERREQAERFLRDHPPGPGPLAGEANRRAMGCRRGRLSGREFPHSLGGVERQISRHDPEFLERRRRKNRRARLSPDGQPRPLSARAVVARMPVSISSPRTTASR